jgi:hypothetical protein
MSWDGFCIMCQRNVELPAPPEDGALPDCPVCSSPVVALAEEEEVPWVVEA